MAVAGSLPVPVGAAARLQQCAAQWVLLKLERHPAAIGSTQLQEMVQYGLFRDGIQPATGKQSCDDAYTVLLVERRRLGRAGHRRNQEVQAERESKPRVQAGGTKRAEPGVAGQRHHRSDQRLFWPVWGGTER